MFLKTAGVVKLTVTSADTTDDIKSYLVKQLTGQVQGHIDFISWSLQLTNVLSPQPLFLISRNVAQLIKP